MQLQKIYLEIFKCVSKLKSWWKLCQGDTESGRTKNQPADVGDWIASFKVSDDKKYWAGFSLQNPAYAMT